MIRFFVLSHAPYTVRVRIAREDLIRQDACRHAIGVFDDVAEGAPEVTLDWTATHAAFLYVYNHEWHDWLALANLIPPLGDILTLREFDAVMTAWDDVHTPRYGVGRYPGVFVAHADGTYECAAHCAGRLDLGGEDVQTWRVGAGGWLAPVHCAVCGVYLDGPDD